MGRPTDSREHDLIAAQLTPYRALRFDASVDLHTNGVSLLTDKFNHRAVATWE